MIQVFLRVTLGTYVVSALTSYVVRELIAPSRKVLKKNERGETVVAVKPYTFALTDEDLKRLESDPQVQVILRTGQRRNKMFGEHLEAT